MTTMHNIQTHEGEVHLWGVDKARRPLSLSSPIGFDRSVSTAIHSLE
jgi:hypothetical protein